jgi:hypothetical protein
LTSLVYDSGQLLFQTMQSLNRIFDRVNAFLEDDLLSRMFESLLGEPAPMRQRPMTSPAVDSATT